MSTNVPIISVTTTESCNSHSNRRDSYEHHQTSTSSDSEDNSDSYSNDMDYNQNFGGGATDVEDFDSYGDMERPRSRRSSKNILTVTPGGDDVTDVEDYNDSEADDEEDKSNIYPELKLSLREFLQYDIQEHLSSTNGMKEVVERKTGNFLQAQNLNSLNDYLTDCEDYNTDSEVENNCEKSACVDLNEAFVEQGRVNIADTTVKAKDPEDSDNVYDDLSVVSDVSDMASAVCDIMGKAERGMSEDEILELSGDEEICQISCSDSDSISNAGNVSEEDLLSSVSLPPIDVTFVRPTNRSKQNNDTSMLGAASCSGASKNMFLQAKLNKKDEVLTDIERFDDSVAESGDDDSFDDGDDDNQQPIPQAVIMPTGDDGGCTTDCEDIFCDDFSEIAQESAHSVDINAIPLPQREVVVLQEDKYGDTITNVMPMDKEYQFGIYATIKDECITDTEEFSCNDDIENLLTANGNRSRSPSPLPNQILVEPDVIVANEVLKTQQSKRLEIISNAEAVTDVEEMYMDGTNSRRKKLKSRSLSKGKSKFLEPPKAAAGEDGGGTDIEDLDISESEQLVTNISAKTSETNRPILNSQSDKFTDVEDITADDASYASEAELPAIDTNASGFKEYEASSKNVVVSLETSGSERNKANIHKQKNSNQLKDDSSITTQQQQTDIEDVQLPSDAEECVNTSEPTTTLGDVGVCNELSEMLNESCTTVHEKCINSFNIDAEKLHIKGMPRESHTDIEYVESDESAARGSK